LGRDGGGNAEAEGGFGGEMSIRLARSWSKALKNWTQKAATKLDVDASLKYAGLMGSGGSGWGVVWGAMAEPGVVTFIVVVVVVEDIECCAVVAILAFTTGSIASPSSTSRLGKQRRSSNR
jgi:hypothetical protein